MAADCYTEKIGDRLKKCFGRFVGPAAAPIPPRTPIDIGAMWEVQNPANISVARSQCVEMLVKIGFVSAVAGSPFAPLFLLPLLVLLWKLYVVAVVFSGGGSFFTYFQALT